MKKIFFMALILISVSGILCSCTAGGTQNSPVSQVSIEQSQTVTELSPVSADEVSEDDTQKILDNVFKQYSFTGIAVAVKDGEITYTKCIDKSDSHQTFDTSTVFRVASDTKQFTAAAVMLLQEQGKLSVNDTLEKYFPDYSHAKEITIHHLLSMRSGIADYTDSFSTLGLTDDSKENKAVITKFILDSDLISEPDEMFAYCNSNYFLLAQIIEQVSGMTYEEYLTENIFKPLDMKSTGFYDSYAVEGAVIAEPFIKTDENDNFYKPSASWGAGDMMSNIDDIRKWLKAFEGGSILSDDIIQAVSASYAGDNDMDEYGYGWFISSDGIYHGGNITEYSSAFFTAPDKKCSVIILSNENSNNLYSIMNIMKRELF